MISAPSRLAPDSLAHGWQVLAVVAICGGIFAGSYGLAQNGWLDAASVFLTAFSATFIKVTLAGRRPRLRSFAASSALFSTLSSDFHAWMTESPLIRKVAIATGYGVAFVTGKWVISLMLTTLANPWLAAGVGAVAASVILSPPLWTALTRKVAG